MWVIEIYDLPTDGRASISRRICILSNVVPVLRCNVNGFELPILIRGHLMLLMLDEAFVLLVDLLSNSIITCMHCSS